MPPSPTTSTATASDHPLLKGFYQLAYVVRDIDSTVERLRAFGVERIEVKHDLVQPGASGTIRHSAKAWVGPAMLEIIEPTRDRPSLYEEPLPDGQGAFLHHLGCDVASEAEWAALGATLDRQGLDVSVMRTIPEVLSYAYTDVRAEMGVFLEHVHLIRGGFYDSVPHNRAGEGDFRPLLDGFSQIGFTTGDLDAAKALFGERFGIGRWAERSYPPGEPFRRIALAFAGEVMLELVEPDPEVASPYAERSGAALARPHHLGFRVADEAELDRAARSAEARGVKVVLVRDRPEFRTVMVDARADLGHYLEYVLVREAGRAAFEAVPRG
jgi:catechol 2,3-dioxygenase-like lactoylglutathione lyase family enzyme